MGVCLYCTKSKDRVETGLAHGLPRLTRGGKRGETRLYGKSDPLLERPLPRVVPGAIVRLIWTSRRRVREVHPQLRDFRIRISLRGIVCQQILRPQLVADLLERVIQLGE